MSRRQLLARILFFSLALSASICPTAQVSGYIQEFHPRYKHIATIPGNVLDVRNNEILFERYDDVIASFDLASRTTNVFYTNTVIRSPAFLTGTGILVLADQAIQVEADEQIILGQSQSWFPDFRDHLIEDRFGILRTAYGLVLRDFAARTNCLISASLGFTDVAPNGNVIFTAAIDGTNKAVRWFQDGETKTISIYPMYETPFVATDGTNLLWSEHHAPFGSLYPFGSIFLQGASGVKIEIATDATAYSSQSVRGEAPRYPPAVIKNGWVFFPRNSNTAMKLWRRGPDGSTTQLSESPAWVAAVGDEGTALISANGSVYYVPVTGRQKWISEDFPLAKYFASGNKFYAYGVSEGHLGEGASVYEIEVEQDPFGMVYPSYNPETQIFSFALLPGAAGDYELQRTTDFVVWTPVTKMAATNSYSFEVQASTSPGYFRMHKL